jgi:hypothetical protein
MTNRLQESSIRWEDDGIIEPVQSQILPYPSSSPEDMLALDPPVPIIEDLLYENTNNVLFGASNAFKSFLAVDIACHVANGLPWHGRLTKQGGVVYVAGEGSYGIRALRTPGWHLHHGIPFDNSVPIRVVSVDVLLDVPEEQAAERLYQTSISEFGSPARLYVFDVLKRSMKGSESEDTAVAAVIATQQHLLRLGSGAALLTLTHTGWADQTRSRGHTDLWGSYDTRLKAEGDKERRTTVIEVDRHKDAEGGQSWGFKLEETESVIDTDGTGFSRTLVPVLDDAVIAASKKKGGLKAPKPGGPQHLAVEALKEAIETHGMLPPACNHIPSSVKAVKRETWDLYLEPRFKALYEANNRASRMNAAIKGVIGKFANTWDGWIWLSN